MKLNIYTNIQHIVTKSGWMTKSLFWFVCPLSFCGLSVMYENNVYRLKQVSKDRK